MTSYNLPDYWDTINPCEHFIASWYDINNNLIFTSECTWTDMYGGCMHAYEVSGTGVWQDSWYIVNDPIHGIMEVADDLQKSSIADNILLFWRGYKTVVYQPNAGIIWGKSLELLKSVSNTMKIDYTKSTTIPPFTGYWSEGTQIVCITNHYPTWTDVQGRVFNDVIRLQAMQPWVKKDPTDLSNSCATYYLAKGIGRVAVEWTTYGPSLQVVSVLPQQIARYSGCKVLE